MVEHNLVVKLRYQTSSALQTEWTYYPGTNPLLLLTR